MFGKESIVLILLALDLRLGGLVPVPMPVAVVVHEQTEAWEVLRALLALP